MVPSPKWVLVLAVLMTASLSGCNRAPAAPPELTFQDVDIGFHSGMKVTTLAGLVTETPEEWREFWTRHTTNQTPAPPMPVIDFQKRFVVAVFYGQQPRAGYAIQVSSVAYEDAAYAVGYKTAEPAPGCQTAATPTNSFHIVAVDRVDQGAVVVNFKREARDIIPCT